MLSTEGEDSLMSSPRLFVAIVFGMQMVLVILFFTCVEYDGEMFTSEGDDQVARLYPQFQDVHIMILVGFGFLMTFLKKYGYSSVGLTFLVAATTMQWYIVCDGLISQIFDNAATGEAFGPIKINMHTPILGDFCTAAILITFGALLGKVSPIQLVIIASLETVLFCINENVAKHIGVVDIGGSMVVHLFGAYFGLAVSKVITSQEMVDSSNNAASYRSDLFAMIGTLFLWCYWPSFNSVLAEATARERTVLNTVLAISASCVTTFSMSCLLHYMQDKKDNKIEMNKERIYRMPSPHLEVGGANQATAGVTSSDTNMSTHKRVRFGGLSMVDIQNATLAGGVAVGAVANMVIGPGWALLIGVLSGILSVGGFVHIQPYLQSMMGLHDTCGVHNLHGLPAVLSGLLSIIFAWLATTTSENGQSYSYKNETVLCDVFAYRCEHALSGREQAIIQLEYMLSSLAIAIAGGAITGMIARLVSDPEKNKDGGAAFVDDQWWQVAEGTTYGETNALKKMLLAKVDDISYSRNPVADCLPL